MDHRLAFLERVDRSAVCREPYAHFQVAPALDADLYAELAATFPPLSAFGDIQSMGNNEAVRIPAHRVVDDARFAPVWRDFFRYHVSAGFWDQIRRLFGPELAHEFPTLEARVGRSFDEFTVAMRNGPTVADLNLDCQFVVNTPVTEESTVKAAHVDNQFKLWSALLYFRSPDDDSSGGDFELYRFVRPRRFIRHRVSDDRIERCSVVPYGANRFVAFVNSPDAVHAVSPRSRTDRPRRYINFIAEMRTKVFDLPQARPWDRIMQSDTVKRLLGTAEVPSAKY